MNCRITGLARFSHLLMLFLSVTCLFTVHALAASKVPTHWNITQYGRGDAIHQSMFYTIKSSTGKLVVIDGGWRSDADLVRSIIRNNGNIVSAWIITHPHPDHVGALNEILKNNPTNIRIRKIYTIPVNRRAYKRTKKPWDGYETYDEFRCLTKGSGKLIYLKEKDVVDLIGLKMTVFNSWDKSVNELNANLCNQGSLMFKLEGERQSMLFCSDVGKARQKQLIKRYKKRLESTFVQCAHHGNPGLSEAFYRYVKPDIAFIDAPRFVTHDTSGKDSAPSLICYFKNQRVKVYTFANGNGHHTVRLQ